MSDDNVYLFVPNLIGKQIVSIFMTRAIFHWPDSLESILILFSVSESVVQCTFIFFIYFSIWVFFHEHSRFTGQQGKGRLSPLLLSTTSTRNISRAIAG